HDLSQFKLGSTAREFRALLDEFVDLLLSDRHAFAHQRGSELGAEDIDLDLLSILIKISLFACECFLELTHGETILLRQSRNVAIDLVPAHPEPPFLRFGAQ